MALCRRRRQSTSRYDTISIHKVELNKNEAITSSFHFVLVHLLHNTSYDDHYVQRIPLHTAKKSLSKLQLHRTALWNRLEERHSVVSELCALQWEFYFLVANYSPQSLINQRNKFVTENSGLNNFRINRGCTKARDTHESRSDRAKT